MNLFQTRATACSSANAGIPPLLALGFCSTAYGQMGGVVCHSPRSPLAADHTILSSKLKRK
jgi:hypothetical protein